MEEAKADCLTLYGNDLEMIEEAREVTEEELQRLKYRLEEWECECGTKLNEAGADFRFNGRAWEHHHGYPLGHVEMRKELTFREALEQRIKKGSCVEMFASTEV